MPKEKFTFNFVSKYQVNTKQIQNLNKIVNGVKSNDTTKKDVEDIIDSYFKEHLNNIYNDLLEIDKKLKAVDEIDKSHKRSILNIYNEMNRLNEDLLNKIKSNDTVYKP